jgi:hypothetical protein
MHIPAVFNRVGMFIGWSNIWILPMSPSAEFISSDPRLGLPVVGLDPWSNRSLGAHVEARPSWRSTKDHVSTSMARTVEINVVEFGELGISVALHLKLKLESHGTGLFVWLNKLNFELVRPEHSLAKASVFAQAQID